MKGFLSSSEGCGGTSDKKDREPEHYKISIIVQPHWCVQCQIFDSASYCSWLKKYFEKTHNKITSQFTCQMMRVKDKTVSGRATGFVTHKEKVFFFSLGMRPLLSNNLIDPCL